MGDLRPAAILDGTASCFRSRSSEGDDSQAPATERYLLAAGTSLMVIVLLYVAYLRTDRWAGSRAGHRPSACSGSRSSSVLRPD